MAKNIKVIETFKIGNNEYKKGQTFSFCDELVKMYSDKVQEVKPQKTKQKKEEE